MASQAYIEIAKGAAGSAATVATDATGIGTTSSARFIFGSALTRDEAASLLDQMRSEILHDRRSWPLAST